MNKHGERAAAHRTRSTNKGDYKKRTTKPAVNRNSRQLRQFRQTVYSHYKAHGRDLPWRNTSDPYKILVSEIMLQQTQASRVIEKYKIFTSQFPTAASVAKSPAAAILKAWSGLGYNRRALYLQQACRQIVAQHNGKVPADINQLVALPGIGFNTAAAICAYAYNQAVPFIETNIRTVYIYHFFTEAQQVPDKQLLPFVSASLDAANPRLWYWALMDYGSYLKKTVSNFSKFSAGYAKQKPFIGSKRQKRGLVLKALLAQPQTAAQLAEKLALKTEELQPILAALEQESFIKQKRQRYHII